MMKQCIFRLFIIAATVMMIGPVHASFGKEKIEEVIKEFDESFDSAIPAGNPHIHSIEPASGSPCITVTINGINLGYRSVRFGSKTARIIDYSRDKLIVEVPYPDYGKRTVEVKVGTFDLSNSLTFTYESPKVDSISPSVGNIGTEVTIEGRHFGLKGSHPRFYVRFGKSVVAVPIVSWEDKKIVVKAPSDYGTGKADERVRSWMIEFAKAGATGGMTIPQFVLHVIQDLATSEVKIPPGVKKLSVDVRVVTPVTESNAKVFTYQLSDEKLPTLPLPQWEEKLLVEGLATSLVMDRSGSMRGEKLERAQQAAYVYVDTSAENEDVVSVVAFASSATTITQPISIETGRETLKQNILSVASGGNTNVGAGLAIAFDHLSLSSKQKKTAVLLSDGRNNSGSYEPEVAKFKKQGWPISTVAFGSDADQKMLSQIAYETGGSFFPAGSFDISRVYHKINVQAHNGSVLRSYSEFVKPGKPLYYDVPVQDDMKKIGFFTNWQGSRMETKVVSPSGTEIDKRNCDKYGKYVEAVTHNLLEIDNPESGDWQVEIIGHDLPKKGEQVNFHCYCESGIMSNILGFQTSYSQNQKVTIGVKLCEIVSGRPKPLKSAHVTAEVKKPTIYAEKKGKKVEINVDLFGIIKDVSGIGKKITLFDDGRHEDIEAGDGIYANTYKDTAAKGPHLVTIDCEVHDSEGNLFKRRLQESFQVGAIEQNAFTISEFLRLLTPKISSGQTRATRTKQRDEQKDKGPLESVFDLFKKK